MEFDQDAVVNNPFFKKDYMIYVGNSFPHPFISENSESSQEHE